MKFELKSAVKTGLAIHNEDNTLTQHLNISIGVVGCPHEDIKTEKTVPYTYSENITAKQAEEGIIPFAESWVASNYPEII